LSRQIKHRTCLALALVAISAISQARTLPHAELVARYMQNDQYKRILASCKSRPMSAPAPGNDQELQCWAANTANDLRQEPGTVSSLVLNSTAFDAASARCKPLSMEQRFKSQECAAVGRADTFISLRLPRLASALKPVTFK
jgi:hypothetical protein